jgi:CBS domain-containing protein
MSATTVSLERTDLGRRPIAEAVTARGKELSGGASVGDARRLLAKATVRVIPVVDGERYVGAVDRDSIPAEAPDDSPVRFYATALVPTVYATTPTADALATLDRHGGRRLVVLGDRVSYVGLLCLRRDRKRLCVDADCHSIRPERTRR